MSNGSIRRTLAAKKKLAKIDKLLAGKYETPERETRDPLDELIMTILSQNTNGRNRERAFAAMKEVG